MSGHDQHQNEAGLCRARQLVCLQTHLREMLNLVVSHRVAAPEPLSPSWETKEGASR